MANVTIYTSPTCAACNAAKQFLKSKNVSYTECNIEKDTGKAEEIAKKTGQTAVPVIEIDGKFIVGFEQNKIAEALGLQP